MNRITSFVRSWMPFLLDRDSYEVTRAEESKVNGGDSFVELASDRLHFRFFTDRDQLFVDLRPAVSLRGKTYRGARSRSREISYDHRLPRKTASIEVERSSEVEIGED